MHPKGPSDVGLDNGLCSFYGVLHVRSLSRPNPGRGVANI